MHVKLQSVLQRFKFIFLLLIVSLTIASTTGCREFGIFMDSPVSGLTYETESKKGTVTTQTTEDGMFFYKEGATVTFSIGSLVLGSAVGSCVITPMDLVPDAEDSSDRRVVNMCVLLQTLDQNGDLNDGIQITKEISDIVSESGVINFDQSTRAFAADPNVRGMLTALNAASPAVFTDTDPRPRMLRGATAALDHFIRSTSERKIVMTRNGAIKGYAPNDDTWQFLGIPYAKPPLGELRWRPPVPVKSWKGVRDAIAWSDQAAQNPLYQSIGEGGMSEDCLYLNVTSPKGARKLPVMVWFHGGAFTILTSNSKQYNNADSLTTKDVVLVTVNHRLGPFGYFSHPLLAEEAPYGGSGNYGQMDLVAALQWVKKNISAFGGDPHNVTIFGQSGGGGKVISLMNSPMAKGLFHKAVCQSGMAPADPVSTHESVIAGAEAIGVAMFNRLGVTTLEEARALPWTAIVQSDISAGIPREIYRPTIDYCYISKSYYETMLEGLPGDVPFMTGVTTGDYSTLRAALPIFIVQRTPYYKSNQYVYIFNRVPDGWADMGLLSGHGGELPYLFNYPLGLASNYTLGLVLTPEGAKPPIGDLNGNGISGTAGDIADIYASMQYGATDVLISDMMMEIWTNFARTGAPDTDFISWPVYSLSNDMYVEIGPTTATVETGLTTVFQ